MVRGLFQMFNIWDSDDEEDLDFLREMTEELDAEEAANDERVRKPRVYLRRDREEGGKDLHKHYFQEHPTYLDRWFRRRFRMSRDLFLRIQNDILSYDVEPLPSHFEYFIQKRDVLGRLGFTTEQKITSALRQLAYGTAADMKPTSSDIARLYSAHEEKHGIKGMLESIDCMHWKWKNCPVAWKGQYTSGHQGHPTIVLEAVASYDTWIWHAFFGAAGANNDVNVLNQSSLFDDIKNGNAPFV
ncbi:uncharacterized protein [Rutidosis leptorrhynchoides]|uniref:uncharacterized protein n=1 Tax=Rutidosis leptorrhynchoides TaxID=125765 RepID=UPI003A98F75C